jgi:hypothetical protein
MYYEEFRNGAWQRIGIDGEMLTGRAHHAVYFASPERWRTYPAWARDRREEIIARVKSEFREPDYEYGPAGTVPASVSGAAKLPSRQVRAQLFVAALLLGLAGAMAWLVAEGVATGDTLLPLKQATLRRTVLRDDDPLMFWVSIGIYAVVGLGAAGLVAWGIGQSRREK